ncbi:MAG: nucleotidyltransferase family protein [Acidobacteriota bacterium]|nr:nucleotidyltransferase family protein [Acidobacteriota bacterium]
MHTVIPDDQSVQLSQTPEAFIDEETSDFYRRAIDILDAAHVPFLVGGAYAFSQYTGIARPSKDFDLFLKRGDLERAMAAFSAQGFATEIRFEHWLAKVFGPRELFVDLIFSSGNGIAEVDEGWFTYAPEGTVFSRQVKLCPPEEMIWSKAFIQERERFDGADVAHIFKSRADRMDWPRLIVRFGQNWRVLYSHLVLFGYIYPDNRALIPSWVMSELNMRLIEETTTAVPVDRVCNGPVLSRQQYLPDLAQGYEDGRVAPIGNMTEEQVAAWTDAIQVDGDGAPRS